MRVRPFSSDVLTLASFGAAAFSGSKPERRAVFPASDTVIFGCSRTGIAPL